MSSADAAKVPDHIGELLAQERLNSESRPQPQDNLAVAHWRVELSSSYFVGEPKIWWCEHGIVIGLLCPLRFFWSEKSKCKTVPLVWGRTQFLQEQLYLILIILFKYRKFVGNMHKVRSGKTLCTAIDLKLWQNGTRKKLVRKKNHQTFNAFLLGSLADAYFSVRKYFIVKYTPGKNARCTANVLCVKALCS